MTIRSFLAVCLLLAGAGSLYAQRANEPEDTLQRVVVTGSNQATRVQLMPYSVTTVTSEEIEATGQTQLLGALAGRIPSLFITQRNVFGFGVSNGGSGGLKIRGVGGSPTNAVLMMVDGKPQFSGVFSHPVADNYEADYVDHVEVLRGPASVLYGSNAMGGTINVITRKPQHEGVETTVRSAYGSYNTWQSSVTSCVRMGRFFSLVNVGYDRTDGTEAGFDFWQSSGYAKVGYEVSDHWTATGDYALMKFRGNDPIYDATLASPKGNVYEQDVVRGEASVVASNRYARTNGAVRLYFSHGRHKINDTGAFESRDDRMGALLYQNYQPWRMTNLTVGFDLNRYTGKVPVSGGKVYTPGDVNTMDRREIVEYSPYVTASQGVADNLVVLSAGVRMAGSNRFGTFWLPQGGLAVNPGWGWTLRASVAEGYRNPSFRELFLYMPANPDLKPERMTNYEVGLEKRFGRVLSIALTGYLAEGRDMITTVNRKNVNTGDFRNKGFEVALSSQPIRSVHLKASYSYLHTNMAEKNRHGAPTHQYFVGADWRVLPELTVNASVSGVGNLLVVYEPTRNTYQCDVHNYALLNVRLAYRVRPFMEVFLQGNNLTDARYEINKGYRMPGITCSGGFKVKF